VSPVKAKQFADEWIEAWNQHDLERILSHYAEDFTMSSPYIIDVMNEPSGKLKGKTAIAAYWGRALAKFPDLRFELIDVLAGANSVAINYYGRGRRRACEVFFFDAAGKVVNAAAHYRD
jgi:ketosteroid isomerase-like protein